ncbi:sulfite exporter TauE/SafE family protein 3-like isoform X2 [Cicer arietinum]|uniref:Sulfite exporter TauE/SafE family protein 3-like isoform X1 n=1 Tax=Cicer arietinum TaxID=3827 RepID=A0A1S3EAA1_CICAR|nr:sulfite exporter TauE/SafE family protein 3-like isoform X1 [Cicer arietinum]
MMMALHGSKRVLVICFLLILLSAYVTSSHQYTDQKTNETKGVDGNYNHHAKVFYKHTWPGMKFGWRIIVGTIIGFLGSSFGTVGGVGGGGIFVPMLTLVIGFDAKSATAISKFMITGGAGATVFYNLKKRHPSLDLPVIDYDLALLFQPMLMLGISLGVAFNVIFPDWMITTLLIIFFTGISVNAFLKGVNTWKKETLTKKEARENLQLSDVRRTEEGALDLQAGESVNESQTNTNLPRKNVSVMENVYWKELGLLFSVWIMILALQIGKNYTTTCSVAYWILNLLQVPITVGVSSYEAVLLYKGKRVIASKGDQQTQWSVQQLILYCACGIVAGIIGGLLGLGGGFILGPLFIGLGIPPQVSSATSTFAMTFSASMSVVEYYLLKRFPISYALYFVAVATVAALIGQHLVRKLIAILGRASIIIFILALTVFVSGISLGGTGIANLIKRVENKEYMGFGNLCEYRVRN